MSLGEPARGGAHRGWLGAILALSYGLRVALAWGGGEGYWPDENRYTSARDAAYDLIHGSWRAAAGELLGHADHLLFRWFALPAALFEEAAGRHPVAAACYFGLYSVLAIALVWAVARRLGVSDGEALWAAGLAAGANSLFYFSRHFLPYDMSLCLMLAGLWLAAGPAAARRSFFAGATVGVGFLTYNGYWLLGGTVLVLHAALGAGGWRRAPVRAAWAGAGLAAALAVVLGAGEALGYPLVASTRSFSGTVIQGDFHLGWQVVAAYLWHAEGGLLLLWLAAFAYALAGAARDGYCGRLAWSAGGVALLGGGLVFFSDCVPKFVVYGRLVRGLTPFLCLGAAAGISRLTAAGGRARTRTAAAIAALVAVGAAWNFSGPLRQTFPDEFVRKAAAIVWRAQRTQPGLFRLLNANGLPGGRVSADAQPRTVLLERRHPLQFQPYLYEGYDAEQRRELRGRDIAMKLVRLDGIVSPAPRFGGYPGPLRLRVKFPADRMLTSEPLVTTGFTGSACFVYVSYVDAGHVRFGYDCWGSGGATSTPVPVDFAAEHDLLVFFGGMLPPSDPGGRIGPTGLFAGLRGSLLVVLDGRTVMAERVPVNPSPPEAVTLGVNFAGGSHAGEVFNGEWLSVEPATLAEVEARLPRVASDRARSEAAEGKVTRLPLSRLVRRPDPTWGGHSGPLRLKLRFPSSPSGPSEPLLVSGVGGRGDFIYVRYLPGGRIRLGFDHWGVGGTESPPVGLGPPGRDHELLISEGSLFPPAGGEFDRRHPSWSRLRDWLVLAWDGRPLLVAPLRAYPADPDRIWVGFNPIGGSTAGPRFSGEIDRVQTVGPETLAPWIGAPRAR